MENRRITPQTGLVYLKDIPSACCPYSLLSLSEGTDSLGLSLSPGANCPESNETVMLHEKSELEVGGWRTTYLIPGIKITRFESGIISSDQGRKPKGLRDHQYETCLSADFQSWKKTQRSPDLALLK